MLPSPPFRTADEWPDRWFVTNGVVAVGPVSFGLLLRGVAQGRIPSGSSVRHESWQVWRRLEDIGALSPDGRKRTVEDLATLSSSLELRASSPTSEAPAPPSGHELRSDTARWSVSPARGSARPAAIDPAGVLDHAADLGSALLLALSTAATAASAEVGLVHLHRKDLGAVVTVGGHGPQTERLLGERLTEGDPTLRAARAGHTVLGEPEFGENSRYLLGRLRRCLPDARGVAMVPLLVFGELTAIFEVARCGRSFRAREIARVEDVIEVLAARCLAMGWL
ncbi:MAG TPA: hypothetical protein VER33_18770 [Polyangiaceae bacterium]|nr:hypothetical protein [Polyangiaceae bacterium]